MFATVIVLLFASQKVEVRAANVAVAEHGWQVHFSSALNKKAIDEGHIFITNSANKKVDAELKLSEDRKTLKVNGLKADEYMLNLEDEAVHSKLFKTLKQKKIDFTVYDSVSSVQSAEDLEAYFARAKSFYGTDAIEYEEESSNSVSVESSAKEDSAISGSDHSTTNVQVAGVDEADFVKTDGQYVYAISQGEKITITDIRNPQKMKVLSEIKREEGYNPMQLFLHDDLLIVLGSKMEQNDRNDRRYYNFDHFTTVRLYSITDKAKPQLIREIGAEGYMNTARKTGDLLYVITNMQPMYWIMEDLEGEKLRPALYDSSEKKAKSYMAYEDISILPGAVEPTYSIITAIDLSTPAKSTLKTKGFLGSSEIVYMTKDHLYLTATQFEKNNGMEEKMIWNPENMSTAFFKYKLDGVNVTFQRSAEMKGTVLNQFSMDEYNDHFRVAMTEGNMWNTQRPSQNHLYIFDENMKLTGSVKGMAKGERIYSARFMGEKAYIVTFRETDPLFVIDVANPAKPTVLGELKIEGFSNYLHPIDENHLIGFGYDTVAEKNPSGGEPIIRTKGMKLSLFDVTDFSNPKEKDKTIIGGSGTHSPLQYDHKALFKQPKQNLYGFPASIYEEGEKNHEVNYIGSGALIYEITPEKGIVLKGDLIKRKAKGQQYEEWEKQIQRIIYSGNHLYTLSHSEITSYEIDTYKETGKLNIQ